MSSEFVISIRSAWPIDNRRLLASCDRVLGQERVPDHVREHQHAIWPARVTCCLSRKTIGQDRLQRALNVTLSGKKS